ncbi:unnamed protein product [Zymoseptoria tritici ST99CH_1A5]|uniref:Uncharacterized protein n=1 Tax=Zymoseptoria tritici ST99CH_1A5 TaxID=1276529 RepID=A0A1Y6LSI0_ZYMTR|nr:unnamed protein product [Zymoseptoria tritici ST99CH_1A5]
MSHMDLDLAGAPSCHNNPNSKHTCQAAAERERRPTATPFVPSGYMDNSITIQPTSSPTILDPPFMSEYMIITKSSTSSSTTNMSGVPDFNNTSSPTLQPPPSSASCKSEAPANEQGDNNEMPEEWEGDTVEDKEFGPYPEFDDMLAERGRDPFHAEIDEACKPYKVVLMALFEDTGSAPINEEGFELNPVLLRRRYLEFTAAHTTYRYSRGINIYHPIKHPRSVGSLRSLSLIRITHQDRLFARQHLFHAMGPPSLDQPRGSRSQLHAFARFPHPEQNSSAAVSQIRHPFAAVLVVSTLVMYFDILKT